MIWSTGSLDPKSKIRNPGFTLVEVLVVLGIMGLMLGIGVPGLVAYARQARLRATARQVVGLVSLARSSAISSRQEQAVVFDE